MSVLFRPIADQSSKIDLTDALLAVIAQEPWRLHRRK